MDLKSTSAAKILFTATLLQTNGYFGVRESAYYVILESNKQKRSHIACGIYWLDVFFAAHYY
jgi:hypothetical protein